ncbi:twin-arginine translocase subunit TatC [Haloferax sp. DFSO60]|uniref:twin-arginine translocase subunit TatC n=1 Tax=Haloferax sp. DFSO60 TaxID=3388652 RepID=UPI00397CE340
MAEDERDDGPSADEREPPVSTTERHPPALDDDGDGDGTLDDEDDETTDVDAAPDDSDSDDSDSSSTEPVYGRVTPPEESELGSDEADEDAAPDGETDDESETGHSDQSLVETDEDGNLVRKDEQTSEDGEEGDSDEPGSSLTKTQPELQAEPEDAYTDDFDDGLVGGGPDTDQEMPLTAHIEEMVRRVAVVLGVAGFVTLLLFPGADIANALFGLNLPSATDVINFLWNSHIPGADAIESRRPRLYGPLELIITKLKVAGLAGTVIGLPVFVYETYLFMRPGLYKRERKYYLAAVPTSLILALVGVLFAHLIVLPAIFAYFTSYTEGTAVIAFGLKETFNLILILMGYLAIVFQIPLFVQLAIMMKLVTRTWLENRRLLFWGAFLGIAFLVSPDPTGMAPILIAITMIVLFEGTLAILRWTGN